MLDIPRPVDDKCFASDGLVVDKAPKAAVMTIVAIVAHDKNRLWWHSDRAVIITGRLHGGAVKMNGLLHLKKFTITKTFLSFISMRSPAIPITRLI